MKKIIKNIFSQNFLLPFQKNKNFIFVYHDVSEPTSDHYSPLYSTQIQTFIKQIIFLKKHFILVSLEELLSKQKEQDSRNYATIVFDDGFYSVIKSAMPILEKEGIPFTVFLNQTAIEKNQLWLSNLVINKNNIEYLEAIYKHYLIHQTDFNTFIQNPVHTCITLLDFEQGVDIFYDLYPLQKNNDKVYMDQDDVLYLNSKGILIGSHSKQHLVLSRCSTNLLENEISSNKDFLENLTHNSIQHFAIPFGKKEHYNKSVQDICSKIGHQYIYTTNPMYIDEKSTTAVPRIGLTNPSPQELMFLINRTFLKKYDL